MKTQMFLPVLFEHETPEPTPDGGFKFHLRMLVNPATVTVETGGGKRAKVMGRVAGVLGGGVELSMSPKERESTLFMPPLEAWKTYYELLRPSVKQLPEGHPLNDFATQLRDHLYAGFDDYAYCGPNGDVVLAVLKNRILDFFYKQTEVARKAVVDSGKNTNDGN